MNRVLVNIYLKKDSRIADFMDAETKKSGALKEQGIIEHMFLKEDGEGAVVVFKNVDLDTVKKMMSEFPLTPFHEKIEFLPLTKLY